MLFMVIRVLILILSLAKGISAGLWVDFGEAWAVAAGLHPAPTCKRSWTAIGGHRRDFVLGCPLAAAAILSCSVQPDRWIAPHLAVRAFFDCGRWDSWVTQPVRCTPLWPASWLPIVDKTRGSLSAEVQSADVIVAVLRVQVVTISGSGGSETLPISPCADDER